MSFCWTNEECNFRIQENTQRNQLSRAFDNNQKLNTKAYLNPQMVNYEFIRRSLSKNLRRGGKIHVNPNFKGNGLRNVSIKSYPHLNTVHLNSDNNALNKPGTSEASNICGEKKCETASLAIKEKNFNCNTVILQSKFKKVNTVNIKKNESFYSWSKNKPDRTDSNVMIKAVTPVNQKSTIINYKRSAYKYTSLKKANDKRICTPIRKHSNLSKFIYTKNKRLSVLMVAKAVRSKYKYLNNLEQYKKSKYKIDKRNKSCENVKNKSNKIKDIRKLFPNYSYIKVKLSSHNIFNVNKRCAIIKGNHSWSENQQSVKNIKKVVNHTSNKRVVNIGGILYKSTANKLTLANKPIEGSKEKTIINNLKGKKNHVVYVRGEKFILENNGKALRRQSEANEKTPLLIPKRIDIGGVTYLQKSHNILIRTNVHQARHFVNKAKNKSIALLVNLHKRSTMPCMIYHQFGRCIRHSKGLCKYKHDPKNITVCKKFLKGNCADNNCLLSHQVIQEKMATCHFFLKGLCVRENCPFLHVKLNKSAAICEKFLQGFCHLGKDCSKRHLHQCPEFDKFGICKLGSKCHYPHKKLVKTNKSQDVKDNLNQNSDEPKDESNTVQYYIKSDIQRKQKRGKKSAAKLKEITSAKVQKKTTKKKGLFLNDSVENNDTVECFPKRIKLDKLPCFIPLASDS